MSLQARTAARTDRVLAHVDRWLRNPPASASQEVRQAFQEEFTALLHEALNAGIDVPAWLAHSLHTVAAVLPEGIESLLARRPGSWEADSVRDLAEAYPRKAPAHGGLNDRLIDLFSRGNDASLEFGDWFADTLSQVAAPLRSKAEHLLIYSRSTRRNDAVRQLVYGTIGWPGTETVR